jgi:hypothetical protein
LTIPPVIERQRDNGLSSRGSPREPQRQANEPCRRKEKKTPQDTQDMTEAQPLQIPRPPRSRLGLDARRSWCSSTSELQRRDASRRASFSRIGKPPSTGHKQSGQLKPRRARPSDAWNGDSTGPALSRRMREQTRGTPFSPVPKDADECSRVVTKKRHSRPARRGPAPSPKACP